MLAVQRNIVGAAKDMSKEGYKGDVYIDAVASGVKINEIANFIKPGSPISNLLNEGVVSNINIKAIDGLLTVTRSTLKVKQ